MSDTWTYLERLRLVAVMISRQQRGMGQILCVYLFPVDTPEEDLVPSAF